MTKKWLNKIITDTEALPPMDFMEALLDACQPEGVLLGVVREYLDNTREGTASVLDMLPDDKWPVYEAKTYTTEPDAHGDAVRKVRADMSLDEWLGAVQVYSPGMWEDDQGPADWYAVADDDKGIIACFGESRDAFRFRLDYINRQLNP